MKKEKPQIKNKTTNIPKAAPTKPATELELTKATQDLVVEVNKLKDLEFFQVFKHPWKFMWFSFLKGVMVGLGTVFAVTVLLSLIIFVLSKIEFIPIVGDFVEKIINQIEGYQN